MIAFPWVQIIYIFLCIVHIRITYVIKEVESICGGHIKEHTLELQTAQEQPGRKQVVKLQIYYKH